MADSPFSFADLSTLFKDDDGLVIGDSTTSDIKAYLHTGSLSMDWQLSECRYRGGYPSGRSIELFGPEAVGKSTLVTHAMVSAQQGNGVLVDWVPTVDETGKKKLLPQISTTRKMKPGLAILIDSECKFPIDRAQRMGLNLDQLIRIVGKEDKNGKATALTFEQCIEQMESVLNRVGQIPYFQTSEVPVVVALDSLSQSPIEAELEGEGLQDGIAAKARKIRMAMRRLTSKISNMNIFMLFVSHVYARIGAPGNEVSGGRGLKLAASLRLGLTKAFPNGDLKFGTDQVGIVTKIECAKSSYCTPPDAIRVPIRYLTGLDQDYELQMFFTDEAVKKLAESKGIALPLVEQGNRLKLVAQDKVFWPRDLSAALNSSPGSREHLLEVYGKILQT